MPVLQGSARQSIRLRASQPCEEPVSRLGGAPNLPPDIEWPTTPDGDPMAFLAQLDLAALPPIEGMDLPAKGALFFFNYDEGDHYGGEPEDMALWRVIFTTLDLASIPLRAFPDELDEHSRFTPFAFAATVDLTFPALTQATAQQLQLTEDEVAKLFGLLYAEGGIHRVGGLPDEIQGDVALEAHMASSGIEFIGSEGTEDWTLLFQLDSQHQAGMIWGSAGRLYFLIRKADLACQRFDKVWTIMQC